MATIASLAVNFVARTAELRQGLDRARAINRNFVRSTNAQLNSLRGNLATLRTAFIGAFAFAGVGSFTRIADDFIGINNLLRAAGFAGEDLADAFARVQQITLNTRSDLEATGRLYALLNRNAASLGATQEEIGIATTAVQQAFALAGASAAEAAGATRQLSQALASGVLRGQELNSVMEQAPLIAQAIAESLNIGLGELRALAAEGRITSDVVFQSLLGASTRFNQQFMQSSVTFGQLANILRAQLTPVFGELAGRILPLAQRGAAQLATSFQFLSNNLDTVVDTIRALLAFLGARLVAIVIPAAIAGFRAMAIGLISIAAAARTASLSLGAILGPIGLLIQAGAVLASFFADELVGAFRTAINFIVRQLNSLIGGIDRLIEFFGGNGIDFRFQEWTSTTTDTAAAIGMLNTELAALPSLVLETDTAVSALDSTLTEAMDTVANINQLGANTFDRLADSLTDFVTTGRFEIRQFAADIIREFVNIQIRAALSQSIAGGGFLSGLFGGFRQQGGPVAAGQAYVVGEAGPELFIPNTAGTIAANGSAAAGGGGTTNITINAIDSRSFQQRLAEDPSFLSSVVERGNRQLGRM